MDLIKLVSAFCTLTYVQGSIDASRAHLLSSGHTVVIRLPLLEKFKKHANLVTIAQEVERSWVLYPAPPNGMKGVDIVVLMLVSYSYSVNPFTFPWNGATHATFQRLWRLIERISFDTDDTLIKSATGSRCVVGYSTSHELTSSAIKEYSRTLGAKATHMITDLRKEMKSAPVRMGQAMYVTSEIDVACYLALSGIRKP